MKVKHLKTREVSMSHTYFCIWIHVVWSTRDQLKLLNEKRIKNLFFHLKKKADNLKIHLDLLNGTEDHIHCLFCIKPKYSISWLINNLKGESSHWLNEHEKNLKFYWQKGYSVFSVSQSNVQKVRDYIINQKEHHKKRCFDEEFRELLEKHKIKIKEY